jgi:hypothetical protein
VFSKGGATGDLFVMRANGTGIRQITQTELSETGPTGAPGPPLIASGRGEPPSRPASDPGRLVIGGQSAGQQRRGDGRSPGLCRSSISKEAACVQLANAVAGLLAGARADDELVHVALARVGLPIGALDELPSSACPPQPHARWLTRWPRNEIERLAATDDLTGRSNRRHWLAEVRVRVAACQGAARRRRFKSAGIVEKGHNSRPARRRARRSSHRAEVACSASASIRQRRDASAHARAGDPDTPLP